MFQSFETDCTIIFGDMYINYLKKNTKFQPEIH